MCLDLDMDKDTLIEQYFREGYPYKAILNFLSTLHGISMSMRTLKRILKRSNLRRRVDKNDWPRHVRLVKRIIEEELSGSGQLIGYRRMWRRIIRKYKIPAARKTVMGLMAYLDPQGSIERESHRLRRRQYVVKGPNEVWHCDGHDKLLPYGLALHGCIDGYSRRIMWLRVGTTNKNPKVICWYFLEAVESIKGAPKLLRCDLGTENAVLAYVQPFLRRNHSDSRKRLNSFRYGKSTSNQRIEALWSQLLRSCLYWWIDFFRGLVHYDLFSNASVIQRDCLRFCFSHLLQEELDQFSWEWNTHRIRKSTLYNTTGGIPNELYFTPETSGTTDEKCVTDPLDVTFVKNACTQQYDPPVDLEFAEVAMRHMSQIGLTQLPRNVREATMLYVELVHELEN